MKKTLSVILAIAASFIAGFIFVVLTFFIGELIYTLLNAHQISDLFLFLKRDIDRYVAMLLIPSFAFVVMALFNLSFALGKKQKAIRIVNKCCFFLIPFGAFSAWIYYRRLFALSIVEYPFFWLIAFVIAALVSFLIAPMLERLFFRTYGFILKRFMIDTIDRFIPLHERSEEDEPMPEYARFFAELEANISINRRYKRALGLLGFKINDELTLLKTYGDKGVIAIERHVINLIRRNARLGENQCLVQKGAIFSIIYADKLGAEGAVARYSGLLDNLTVNHKGEDIAINVSIGVSGIDFSKGEWTADEASLRDMLMLDALEALSESERKRSAHVKYF